MQTGNTNCIYRNELNKASFQHGMAYSKSKSLTKRNQPDKFLRDKTFKIASDPKYDGYQRRVASMVYKFFGKTFSGSGVVVEPCYHIVNQFHWQIFRKFKRGKVHSETIFGVLI